MVIVKRIINFGVLSTVQILEEELELKLQYSSGHTPLLLSTRCDTFNS